MLYVYSFLYFPLCTSDKPVLFLLHPISAMHTQHRIYTSQLTQHAYSTYCNKLHIQHRAMIYMIKPSPVWTPIDCGRSPGRAVFLGPCLYTAARAVGHITASPSRPQYQVYVSCVVYVLSCVMYCVLGILRTVGQTRTGAVGPGSGA